MYKKILIFCLSAGTLFTGCQTESVSEEIQAENVSLAGEKTGSDLNSKWHYPDYMEGPSASISNPSWTTGPVPSWHTPDWTIEQALAACSEEVYNGSASLTVNPSSEAVSFTSGTEAATNLENLNLGGKFAFCGYMTVENTVNMRRSAEVALTGGMMIGTTEAPADLVINRGAHLHLAGQIIVTGDLIVNSFAELNLYGEEEKVFIVGGEIIIDEKAEIIDHRDLDQETDHSGHDD